jgi:xanthine/CO dehydrogenase XdhC/CoxF family maturation factor
VLRRTSSGGLPTEVLSFYALHKKHGTVPTLKQLTDIFRQVCLPCQCIHVIVDALDECALSADSALELIVAVRALGPNIRLLCTSRFSTTFEAFFSDSTRIEIFARAEDMRLFLEAQMQNQSRLARHIRADPGLREEIVTTVIEEARGMYVVPMYPIPCKPGAY